MLGDIILWIKRVVKQQLLCVHDYEVVDGQCVVFTYYECSKCGKTKEVW